MTDAAKIARGLVSIALVALSGCVKNDVCVDGKLYTHRGDDVYVRDNWNRECVNKPEISVRAELERNSHE